MRWDGLDERGNRSPAGLYFVRATALGETAGTRFVRVN
jgi:hypothetical protein